MKSQKLAVAYARFSSSGQREESIDAQVRAISEFCKRENIKLLRVYKDEAYSGTTDDRPAFKRMIEEVHDIDYVVVHKLDRFSRDRYDSAINKKKLKDKGIRVLSVLENFDESPESIILESVIEGMNQYYSMNLGREVKKGFKENALKCKHNGGRPPFGYEVVYPDLTYKINDFEAAGVRMVFDMYLNNSGYPAIARALKEGGYKTKSGSDFSKASIYDILGNEKYNGVYVFGRRDRNSRAPTKDIIKIKDGMPRIISEEVWNAAQLKRERNKHMTGTYSAKRINLLTGLIYHECGARMNGSSKPNKKGGKVYYYKCADKCDLDHKSIQAEQIENQVIDALEKYFFGDDKFRIAERMYETYLENLGNKVDLQSLKIQRNLLKKEEKQIVDAVLAGLLSDELVKRNEVNQARLKKIEQEIETFKIRAEYSLDDFKEYVSKFKGLRELDPTEQKAIIEQFVYKIIVYKKNIRVLLKNMTPQMATDSENEGSGPCMVNTRGFEPPA